MSEKIKCGWHGCTEMIDADAGNGATRQYCSDRHKQKASKARVKRARVSRAEFRKERVWKESGFRFAKLMAGCELMAHVFGMNPDLVKSDMIDAMSLRIATYKAEMDA